MKLLFQTLAPGSAEPQSRSTSPRKLIKQVALESPPPLSDLKEFTTRIMEHERKLKTKDRFRIQRDRNRKMTHLGHDPITNKRPESW